MNWINDRLCVTIEGASHAPWVQMSMYGLPYGLPLSLEKVQQWVDGRRSCLFFETPRKEPDTVQWISGVDSNGVVTGPVVARIANTDTRKADYGKVRTVPRPSHADYPAYVKYGPDYDHAGGGAFSGRMTAPMCIAGGIALQYLAMHGIEIQPKVVQIGPVACDLRPDEWLAGPKDKPALQRVFEALNEAMAQNDSLGGVVQIEVTGLPVGLGGMLSGGLESKLAQAVYAVPAVKGVQFGAGFGLAAMRGSAANDPLRWQDGAVRIVSNNAGGINGGLANGNPLVLQAALRPTPTIGRSQHSVDLEKGDNAELVAGGRHDACIVRRAQYGIASAVAVVLAGCYMDYLAEQTDKLTAAQTADTSEQWVGGKVAKEPTLHELRAAIDSCDRRMAQLYAFRMRLCQEVGRYKRKRGLAVTDTKREQALLQSRTAMVPAPYGHGFARAMDSMMHSSKLLQQRFFLLGRHLPYSHSPTIHQSFGLPYELCEVEPVQLATVMRDTTWSGCNVTIPYKQDVIPYLSGMSEIAKRLGVVNTIVRTDRGLHGYNTDYYGLQQAMIHAHIEVAGKVVAIAGSGASSHTAQAVCRDMDASEVLVISRTKGITYEQTQLYRHAQVLINTTPVGTYPTIDAQIVDLTLFDRLEGVVDLTYNPLRTRLLQQAERLGIPHTNGLYMLCAQAARSAQLFGAVRPQVQDAYDKVKNKVCSVVLVGMPGSGKTTVGKRLAQLLDKPLVDTDSEIERCCGQDPAAMIATHGEEYFRQQEAKVVEDVCRVGGQIVATGGGAVIAPDNRMAMRAQGFVVWLRRDLSKLDTVGRPLSQQRGNDLLWQQRQPLYREVSDIAIENNGTVEQTVEAILSAMRTWRC